MIRRFQILSLDGGGIKGLFSAAVLSHLEEDLDINIIQHFDLIAGTSTGGLIALALGAGMSPREIVHFFVSKGPAIFPQNFLSNFRQIFMPKFGSWHLEKAVKACFGQNLLADSKKRLIIPSYNIGDDDIYLFKTPHNERLKRDWKVPMWKVAMATSAAPTYLPVFRNLDNIRLVDGGVWANNPCMVGIVEAISLLGVPLASLKLFSLGTTNEVKGRKKGLDSSGLLGWASDAIEVVLRGQSIGAQTQALHLLGGDNFIRVDPAVADGLFALDKLSEDELLSKAAHVSRKISPAFERVFSSHLAPPYDPSYR